MVPLPSSILRQLERNPAKGTAFECRAPRERYLRQSLGDNRQKRCEPRSGRPILGSPSAIILQTTFGLGSARSDSRDGRGDEGGASYTVPQFFEAANRAESPFTGYCGMTEIGTLGLHLATRIIGLSKKPRGELHLLKKFRSYWRAVMASLLGLSRQKPTGGELQPWITEDLSRAGKVQIRGYQHRAPLVAVGKQPE